MITKDSDHIKIAGYIGTWYVIGDGWFLYPPFCTELERQTEPRAEQEPNKATLGLWRELQPPSPVRGR